MVNLSIISEFILSSDTKDRWLLLEKIVPDGPKYLHCASVLNLSAEDVEKYSVLHYGIKHHWYAMKVYDAFHDTPSTDVNNFSEQVIKCMDIDHQYNQKNLDSIETTYSSAFFYLLNGFLFPGNVKGCVLHRPELMPVNNHCNIPDGYIAKLTDGVPSAPILVSGFKNHSSDEGKAYTASLGYFQSISSISRNHDPLLVMPCLPHKLTLLLCWPISSTEHVTMELCKADEQSNFAKFFAALKCAVCLMDEIKGLGSFVVQPIKGIKLTESI